MPNESPPASEDASPHVCVEFCGSRCWRRSALQELAIRQGQRGCETFAVLAKDAEDASGGADVLVMLESGCAVTLRKTHGCIGACGRDPAARVVIDDNIRDSTCFRAESAEAVCAAVEQALTRDAQASGAGETQ